LKRLHGGRAVDFLIKSEVKLVACFTKRLVIGVYRIGNGDTTLDCSTDGRVDAFASGVEFSLCSRKSLGEA